MSYIKTASRTPATDGMDFLRESNAVALTITEAAAVFGVDVRTISRAIDDGDLPAVKLGTRRFIPRERLLAMLTADDEPATT